MSVPDRSCSSLNDLCRPVIVDRHTETPLERPLSEVGFIAPEPCPPPPSFDAISASGGDPRDFYIYHSQGVRRGMPGMLQIIDGPG